MFAVIKTGGKQYRVAKGDLVAVEKLEGNAGDAVQLSDVMALGGDKPQVGAPLISGAAVAAEIVAQTKTDKVIVFKKKRRQNYRRTQGHRQQQTLLRVTDIITSGAKAAEKPATAAKKAPAPKAEAPKEAKPAAAKSTAKPAAAKKPAAKKAAPAKKTTKE